MGQHGQPDRLVEVNERRRLVVGQNAPRLNSGLNTDSMMVQDMVKSKEGRNQLCLICGLTAALVVVTSLFFIL